ncbi:MAG: hydantoinase/oxoprolinase family protein [Chromatiales bacterium]|nr:hydantoinase/oxoprolinase family protein [Chromatiales bacterium]
MTDFPSAGSPRLLGVDTGGTFTDFVYFDGAGFRVHKVLSTPEAPERAILQGLRELGLALSGLRVIHGSTVATNAVLEGKGVRTAYVTNRGLADVLTIGRQARRDLYDLQPPPVSPPVPAELCLETGGRLAADGSVVEPLTEDDLAALRAELTRLAPEAVAINLLFAFVDDRFERAVEAAVPEGVFVSRSSQVLPEYREYERGMATWLNAYVGPLMQGYLGRLEAGVAPAGLEVMQSHGGTIDAARAGGQAVQLLLSGPAGGLMGARHVARASARDRLLSFDMGGTSTDVAMIDGGIGLTSESEIAGYPVAVPMVDMHTIGAGGGSIAWIDAGGLLQVGPQSAGAAPGPACYGQGGREPTVTDANLVLGHLPASTRLGGGLPVDVAAARAAVGGLAARLGLTVEAAAEGILRIANEHMAQALRVISVQRGIDPRGFTLMPFGGAGGLHVCALADALGMDQALVPVHGGVLSALGMLVAPPGRQLSHSRPGRLEDLDEADLEQGFAGLEAEGRASLSVEGVTDPVAQRSLDLRYEGQASTLSVPWRGLPAAAADFHAAHREAYGHALDMPVELVNLRLGLAGSPPSVPLPAPAAHTPAGPVERLAVHGVGSGVPVYRRSELAAGQRLAGPVIVTEAVATTWIEPGWSVEVDGSSGNLLLSRTK